MLPATPPIKLAKPQPNPLPAKLASKSARAPRAEGLESRQRLLHAALRLFAEQGFAKTSIRDIALAAQTNVAAISYYFGDKTQLYRCAFTEPMGSCQDSIARFDQKGMTLAQSLRAVLAEFVEPLKQDELVRLCVRLHMREMVEPTGVWAQEIDNGIKPTHTALVALLCRQFKLKRADADVHRLAFSIVGLGVNMLVSRDVVQALKPQLLATPKAIDQYASSLLQYALAMVASEAQRRAITLAL
jgi:TetR/AcrR family transcriptional regulator, regulator of cefoperazone and chloramphenicol sensitivity